MTTLDAAERILSILRPVIEAELKRAIDGQVEPVLRAAGQLAEDVKLAYSMQETAELLSVSRTTVEQWVLSGRLQSLQPDRRRLIPRQAIEEFLRSESDAEAERIREGYTVGHGFIRRTHDESAVDTSRKERQGHGKSGR